MSAALEQRMKRVIRQDIQSMHGYAVQPSAGLVKLDTMENPHRLPAPLRQISRRVHRPSSFSRSRAACACARRPSPSASSTAIGPSTCAPASLTSIRLERFWKS